MVVGRLRHLRAVPDQPFDRRAQRGPDVEDVEYARDHPDVDDWADRDGRVYRGDAGPTARGVS